MKWAINEAKGEVNINLWIRVCDYWLGDNIMKLQSHLTSHYLINFPALQIPSFKLKHTPSIHSLFSLPLHGSFFHYCKSSSKYCKNPTKRQLSYLYSEIIKSNILLFVVTILLAADAILVLNMASLSNQDRNWNFYSLGFCSGDQFSWPLNPHLKTLLL